jgi:uncharacterized membrane protein YphA (DoxX/SURF4 family)
MLKETIFNKYFLLAIRILIGFVFLFAAVFKIADTNTFAQSINNYKLLPDILINLTAIILPWIELSTALLLIFGISVKENAAIISGLLIVFIAAIFISLLRGLDIECGCFGTVDGSKIGLQKLLENIGLLLLGLVLIKFDSNYFSLVNKDNK